MPAVNLNRIYMIRARERRPILNGVNVPDAAGAYQRAVQPALRAQLAISENDARIKQDDIHRKYQGIATGIRAFQGTLNGIADIQNAMERARDRQRATALRDLFNDCERNMLEARKKFADAERARFANPDGTYTTQGPLVEAIDSLKAWRESKNDAYAALDDEGKKQFDARFEMKRLEIEAEAAEEQAEQQQKQAAQSIKDDADIQEQKIHTLFDPEDAGKFAGVLPEYMQAKEFAFKFARGQIDAAGAERRPETDEDRAAWEAHARKLRDDIQYARLQHVSNRFIETGDPQYLNELKMWGEVDGWEALKGKGIIDPDDVLRIQDDAKRQEVRALARDAERKREQKIEQDDVARAADAGVQFNNALKMADEALLERGVGAVGRAANAKVALDAGIKAATAMASGISDPVRRQAFMAKVRESERKTLVRYADELRAQVVFGGLAQTDHEAARAQAGKMLEGMEESVRGPLMEKMDLAIATEEANAFIDEFRTTQPDPYFGGTVTPEQKAKQDKMLAYFRAMPDSRKKAIIGRQIFGGGGEAGNSGGGMARQKVQKFTQTDVSFLLSQGGKSPIEVMDMANAAFEATAMDNETYVKCMDMCRARLTFNDAVGNQARDYVSSIYGAVNDAFGISLGDYIQVGNDGIPLVDGNGMPLPAVDGNKKFKTAWLKTGTKLDAADRLFQGKYNAYDMRDQLTILGDTLQEAFAYGMQYVISRRNGLERKGETMTPDAIREELADRFSSFLVTSPNGQVLTARSLQEQIGRARERAALYGVPQHQVEAARERAIQSHMWHGAETIEATEEE